MSRPWSSAEIEEKLPDVLSALHDAVDDLKDMGIESAEAKWHYEEKWAKCRLKASSVDARNASEREAVAMDLLVAMKDDNGVHPGLRRDLAANRYADQRKVIDALSSEIDVARTLLVSARSADK